MKHYHTSMNREGPRLPYSGVIIGKLAEALRLKAALREDVEGISYKTAQRYFAGARIQPETVDLILDALLDTLVPGDLVFGEGYIDGIPARQAVAYGLQQYARHWDWMAAQANQNMFDLEQGRDLPMPVLRLVALDLGIRLGGWAVLRFLMDRPLDWNRSWLRNDALKLYIDGRRSATGLTVSALAEAVNVSTQAVEAWRAGSSMPTNQHIEDLARCLAGSDTRRVEVEYSLRVLVAVAHVSRDLETVIGDDRLDDLLSAVEQTARRSEDVHKRMFAVPPPPNLPPQFRSRWEETKAYMKAQMLQGANWELPIYGARSPSLGESITRALMEQSKWQPEVQADLAVLPGDWSPRIVYWMSQINCAERSIEFAAEHLRDSHGAPAELVREFARGVIEHQFSFGKMFRDPTADGGTVMRFRPPPFGRAMNRITQARTAMSMGDMATAIAHLRHAVRHQPKDAVIHFDLAAALWQYGLPSGDLKMVKEAILECRIAVQLDPDFGNARNEIGVILSNLQRHEEAERAYAEAEPYFGQHNHHWLGRGNNYMALGRLDEAEVAFRRAIELTSEGEHIEAQARLAVSLMAQNKKREARRLGKRVEHVAGADPTKHWENLVNLWGNNPPPGEGFRKRKIGRNEPCPCGSGLKFKRCCLP